MGTSTSHSSPNTSSWKPLKICYTNPKISDEVVVNNVWRAADHKSESNITNLMKSDALQSCYDAVLTSKSADEALHRASNFILHSNSNSIIAELGKRSITIAYTASNPGKQWLQVFFSEVTKYIVSRDASGFVGEKYRNKSVKELLKFKESIANKVSTTIENTDLRNTSSKNWAVIVERVIDKLKNQK